ncbi:amidohydrolase family protein [uncultured Nostoc sp.]|uniref:amidohydrolase family protein n=1 Tax=uncultured Nostoc sp. TaxID=340711 RepID=UPI0035CC8FFC
MDLCVGAVMSPLATTASPLTDDTTKLSKSVFKKIAIEEAFATPELFEEWRKLLVTDAEKEPGFQKLYKPFLNSPATKEIRDRLINVGASRIRDMDLYGIDMQILSITSPGIQVFSADKAVYLAKKSNDQLAEFISAYPERYAGLAAVAPQAPNEAARELERAVKYLGMKGAIINSHTQGEYLDKSKYWVLFEAAQALDIPIYLHPRTPSPEMIKPFLSYGLEGAGWGFAIETSTHAMRLILSGLFDRFPKLKFVLGHLGEGIPFWLSRIDSRFANQTWIKMDDSSRVKQLQKKPSEYFMDNFVVATSGVNWTPALMFALSVLGSDRILFAIDYPYESIALAVEGIDNTPMSDADRKKIYHLNAENLFKLKTDVTKKGVFAPFPFCP